MRTIAKPQNPMEWMAVKANLYPIPLGVIGWILASKAVLLASKLGVFEAAEASPQTIEQVAQRTKLHPRGLAGLLSMLTLHGYFRYRDGKFGLTKLSRKWCLGESPYSLNNQLRYLNEIFWNEMNCLEDFLRTGNGWKFMTTITQKNSGSGINAGSTTRQSLQHGQRPI